MTGTLQTKRLKDGEYYYVVLNLYENGKRKPKWIPTGLRVKGNKKKAELFLRDTLRDYEQKQKMQAAPEHGMRFSDWIRKWLDASKARVDEITWQGYSVQARIHILPYFDDLGIALGDVTRQVLQTYVDFKATKGRMDGKGGLAPRASSIFAAFCIRRSRPPCWKN
jgi:hypothetical protein